MDYADALLNGPGVGEAAKLFELRHHEGLVREVWVKAEERVCPAGSLLVSRTDARGHFTHVNAAFLQVSGYSVDELLGQAHCLLRHPDMPKAVFAQMWASISSGKAWSGHIQNRCKDGSHYWALATVLPSARDGVISGYTSVQRAAPVQGLAGIRQLYSQQRGLEASR
jgi:PAS domain S-box-containing protein